MNEIAVLLFVSPAPLVAAAYAARSVRRVVDERRLRRALLPAGPPIERIAAELRRLLWAHDRAVGAAPAGRWLWALETAIAHRATQAAGALGVTPPQRAPDGRYDEWQLRRLLRQLADAGLVLPGATALMAG